MQKNAEKRLLKKGIKSRSWKLKAEKTTPKTLITSPSAVSSSSPDVDGQVPRARSADMFQTHVVRNKSCRSFQSTRLEESPGNSNQH